MSEPGTRGHGEPAEGPPGQPAAPPATGLHVDLDAGIPVEETTVEAAGGAEEAAPPGGLRGRLARLRPGVPRSRRGIFALLLVSGALGFAGIWTGVTLVHWTETADFCGRCHQMGPELQAYEAGPHRDVTCGECHVEPGVAGWVKAKLNGTRQLVQVLTGLYPKPVPPPDHAALPAVEDTCLRCHSLERLATANLITRTSFTEDEQNTRQFVGLMIRPGSGDVFDVKRSVHWHVLREVRYWTADEDASSIDVVAVTADDGTVRDFISQDRIEVAEDVQPDVDKIKAGEPTRVMDCIQCHNRVGHPIPNPRRSLDADLSSGRISADLPYIKREGMRILWSSYPNVATADTEIEKLDSFYELRYPDVAAARAADIAAAETRLKVLYRISATPDMKVSAASYPDFLGHMDFAGCFRCHDGGHYLVRDGAVTKEVIPSTCDACHTFPQIGTAVASLPLGEPPPTHDDALYVFNHRAVATSVDPGSQSCGECHARDYCLNCHKTGAVNVDHDQMMVNHAQVIRQYGNSSCAYCHQPVYCARCHSEQVLPVTSPFITGTGEAVPQGIRWPLLAATAAGPAATGP